MLAKKKKNEERKPFREGQLRLRKTRGKITAKDKGVGDERKKVCRIIYKKGDRTEKLLSK